MSFFSNLFKKKESEQPVVKVSFSEKVGSAFVDPDIPPLQGDYAKAVFLWAHSKSSPVKDKEHLPLLLLYSEVAESQPINL